MPHKTIFVIALFALALSGCNFLPSHLHDDKSEELTAKLQTEFSAYQQDQTSLYANMAANLEAFEAEENELLSRFASNFQEALVTKGPTITWENLRDMICDAKIRQTDLKTDIHDELKEYLKEKGSKEDELSEVKQSIQLLNSKIKTQKAEIKAWDNMIATYQKAIASLPDTIEDLEERTTGLTTLVEVSQRTISEIQNSSVENAGEGKLALSQEEKNKISLLLQKVPDELTNLVSEKVVDAPGISISILQLGLELAELKKQRSETTLLTMETRSEIYQEALAYSQIAGLLLEEASEGAKGQLLDQQLVVTILNSKASTKKVKNDGEALVMTASEISTSLLALRNFTTAEWLITYQKSLLPVRLARIEHQSSISESQQNDEAWQAIIGSGIDGLAHYHKGGLTQDDIANVIRLGQTLALFIIAY